MCLVYKLYGRNVAILDVSNVDAIYSMQLLVSGSHSPSVSELSSGVLCLHMVDISILLLFAQRSVGTCSVMFLQNGCACCCRNMFLQILTRHGQMPCNQQHAVPLAHTGHLAPWRAITRYLSSVQGTISPDSSQNDQNWFVVTIWHQVMSQPTPPWQALAQ